MKKHFFLLAYLSLGAFGGYSQSIAINTDGSKPNPNAIVDVKSTTKGVLLPRMTTAQRHAIPNTKGLLVYDTDENLYCYNDGFFWQSFFTANLIKNIGPSWSLTGNSHTQDKSNFIGTKDDEPLNIRVNNQSSGRIDDVRWNTYWGYLAGLADSMGYSNTANGAFALQSNITGNQNTAVGARALLTNTRGFGNTGSGFNALANNSTGFNNTATGVLSLASNSIGSFNIAMGYQSLFYNSSGTENTSVGPNGMFLNISGANNTALGNKSLYHNTTGNYNTTAGDNSMFNSSTGTFNAASGAFALSHNTTGSYNLADGATSMITNTSGNNNTGIGFGADVSDENLTNSTAIGNGTIVNASNKVRIGNTNITVIEGQVPFTTPSDGRFKFNIQENVKGLDFILKLRPVTYQFDVKKQEGFTRGTIAPGQLNNYVTTAGNDEATQMIRTGFIAQEVELAAKKTGYDFDGVKAPRTEREYYSLSYSSFVVPLVKAMQEQQQIISSQNQRISNLEQELAEIKILLEAKHN